MFVRDEAYEVHLRSSVQSFPCPILPDGWYILRLSFQLHKGQLLVPHVKSGNRLWTLAGINNLLIT